MIPKRLTMKLICQFNERGGVTTCSRQKSYLRILLQHCMQNNGFFRFCFFKSFFKLSTQVNDPPFVVVGRNNGGISSFQA
jgi:hypothetical protein